MIALTVLALAVAVSDTSEKSALDKASEGHETRQGIVGARMGITRAMGIGAEPATSLLFAGRGEELRTKGMLSTHGAHSWALGGGTSGFEGGLALAVAVGPRIPIHPNHGPFLRLGARGSLQGNRDFYDSLLELPRAELGWQFLRDWTALEVGATYGVILTGRFRVGESEMKRFGNGFSPGAYAVIQFPMMRLGASLYRLPSLDGRTVGVANAYGCAVGSGVALCLDGRWMRGDLVIAGTPHDTTSVYGGVMLGFIPPPPSKDWSKANTWAAGSGTVP